MNTLENALDRSEITKILSRNLGVISHIYAHAVEPQYPIRFADMKIFGGLAKYFDDIQANPEIWTAVLEKEVRTYGQFVHEREGDPLVPIDWNISVDFWNAENWSVITTLLKGSRRAQAQGNARQRAARILNKQDQAA